MGKASSSKKIARAARAGGRVSSGQPRSLLFPGVLTLIVVLGLALVVYARNDRLEDDQGGPPQLEDHLHMALAVNVCGEFLAVLPEFETPVGIHTHGDGVLHIHPFSELGTGSNATLGLFFDLAKDDGGLEVGLSDSKLTYLGESYEEGKAECEGVEDPQLRVAFWSDVQDPESEAEITTGDFTSERLDTEGGAFTIYYGDPEADIPKPPNATELDALGAADQDPTQTTTSTTEAGGSTTTTAAGESTTTTAAGGSTTTTAAP